MDEIDRPHVLREYALLADGFRGALIGPDGAITWMCAPRWDSPALFTGLLGGCGGYAVTPVARHVWGGHYEDPGMIWRSRWVTETGVVECREALAHPGEEHRAVLLRRVCARDAPAELEVRLAPRGDYDRLGLCDLRCAEGIWTARSGKLHLRWTGAGDAHPTGDGLVLRLRLDSGAVHDLVLEIADQPLPDRPPEPDAAWAATQASWRRAVPDSLPCELRRSRAVLTGLTGPGGTVAAATAGLPERAEAGRNYDYRYVWIRDQCYVGRAATAIGAEDLLATSVEVVTARLLEHGDRLAPAYRTTGAPVPDLRRLGLPGYPGGSDVVGNRVNNQFQLDIFGEILLLLAAAAAGGRTDADAQKAAMLAADAIASRWNDPDAGIWELEPRAWTHSRLTAVAGLRAVATAYRPTPRAAEWLSLADRILADTAAEALHPQGHWVRSPGDPASDAALLLPALRGAVPADDPRSAATLAAYRRELVRDGWAWRFRHDARALPAAEGAFLLCGFLMAQALQQQGQEVAARAWYERSTGACGPPHLFSEEYDPVQHQMRGNLPQAFVHAFHLETGARLGLV